MAMMPKPIRCTNCGKIAERASILPLCNECAKGLEDYEEQLIKSLIDIHINIEKPAAKSPETGFLKL
jgi:hypothetical protein